MAERPSAERAAWMRQPAAMPRVVRKAVRRPWARVFRVTRAVSAPGVMVSSAVMPRKASAWESITGQPPIVAPTIARAGRCFLWSCTENDGGCGAAAGGAGDGGPAARGGGGADPAGRGAAGVRGEPGGEVAADGAGVWDGAGPVLRLPGGVRAGHGVAGAVHGGLAL